MSNSSEWVNELRRASTAAVEFREAIGGLYDSMVHNANRYHQLKYANMDPPQTPPPTSDQQAMKQWLVDEGAVSTFPGITENDLWLSAIALNGMVTSLTVSELEHIYRTAQ